MNHANASHCQDLLILQTPSFNCFLPRGKKYIYHKKNNYSLAVQRNVNEIIEAKQVNNMHDPSTFRDATSGFPAKSRLRNDCRNSILMTDLGSASDWLKKTSLAVRPIRITTQIWVMTLSAVIFSDVISRGETSGGVSKCRLFSQADMAPCLPFCISSDSCRIKILLAKSHLYSL